jgi:hypothetical protein
MILRARCLTRFTTNFVQKYLKAVANDHPDRKS